MESKGMVGRDGAEGERCSINVFEASVGEVFGGLPNTVPALAAVAETTSNGAFNQRMAD